MERRCSRTPIWRPRHRSRASRTPTVGTARSRSAGPSRRSDKQFEVTGIAALEAQGNTVTVVPQEISTGNDNLDAAAERLLAGRLVFQAGGLPANVGLTGARGGPDGIVVTASGSNPRCPDHHPVSLSGHRELTTFWTARTLDHVLLTTELTKRRAVDLCRVAACLCRMR